jgi:hypothetical protein
MEQPGGLMVVMREFLRERPQPRKDRDASTPGSAVHRRPPRDVVAVIGEDTLMARPWRGRGGIRTHGRVAPSTVFKTVAFVRSATLPLRFRRLPPHVPDDIGSPAANPGSGSRQGPERCPR